MKKNIFKNMKKRTACLVLSIATMLSLAGCGGSTSDAPKDSGSETSEEKDIAIAFITDLGDITDKGYNQTTYEACRDFSAENGLDFAYYRPEENSAEERTKTIEKSIGDGYNVLVMQSTTFQDTIFEEAGKHPDVKFVTVESFDKETVDSIPDNVYCGFFKEELCGYMAGYAAVKMGYSKLGFLGGIAVPQVVRYGLGFVQGADAAAKEVKAKVTINYAYGNQFYGDAEITQKMDKWYDGGTEVVFACGGSIFTSTGEAAVKHGGKIIGVDVDQKPVIDEMFGEGITLTSATKGVAAAFRSALKTVVDGKWDTIGGKMETLGLVSAENLSENYEGLAESTEWNESFTEDDYKALVSKMISGELTVDDSYDNKEPTAEVVKIKYFGDLK